MNRFRFDRLCVGVLNCPMRNVFFSLLIILGAAVLSSCESTSKTKNGRAQDSSSSQSLIVECHKALEPIVLDGQANEFDWEIAQPISNFHLTWADGRPAKTSTKAKVLWDDQYFYFYAEMEDADLYADVTEKDGDIWGNDVFEIFLKPSVEKTSYYEFHVTAANAHFDLYMPHKGGAWLINRMRKDRKFSMESKVIQRGTLNQWMDRDEGWTVEGRIPWKDFSVTGGRPKPGDEWRFALCRYDYSVGSAQPELSSIAPFKKMDFHRTEDFLPLKFRNATGGGSGDYERKIWNGSNVVGSPEPPMPYITEPMWAGLSVKKPLEMKRLPNNDNYLVYSDHRESKNAISKLWVFRDEPGVTNQVEAISLTNRLVYGFCFHPNFEENGQVFLHTNGPRRGEGSKSKYSAVSRWMMDRDTMKIDQNSHLTIIQWESNGHDGGGVIFGNDGMLYITTGDGTSDSDVNLTGQRIDLLLAKLLRVDVDKPANGKPYGIPHDNPFLDHKGAAPETWALGFRNPWRLTCDQKTGQIWVGENGQDTWESVKLIERGANYGWSVYEGSHPFYLERMLGPGKLTGPTFEHHHREARSLTGGIVYYGKQLPRLRGSYVYGDYSTGKVWAGKHDGQKVLWHREIADTPFAITGFATDTNGNLIVIDDHTGFHRLRTNPQADQAPDFPQSLSQTGLFKDTPHHQVAAGVVPYSVNVPHWADEAESAHFIAIPNNGQLRFSSKRGWDAPEGTVLLQTLSRGEKRIETRMLAKQDDEWVGYSYAWNNGQTDATLVNREGRDLLLSDGRPWRIPSRAECMMCHSRASKFTLGLTELQMNRPRDFGHGPINQIEGLTRLGVLTGAELAEYRPGGKAVGRKLVDPYESQVALEPRVRSYWQANCAHCHVEAGGGNATMELEWGKTLDGTQVVDIEPVHTRFGLGSNARIIAPGYPVNSVMLRRIISPGPGRMPPIGAVSPDPRWIGLFTQWVSELEPVDK
jgi:glucose/arabinose dehydrogenase